MIAAIIIGGTGPFQFSAAHAALHGGEFEPLHGHTCTVTVRLHGDLDGCGMLADFQAVKNALIGAIGPLRRRTLMPARPPGGQCRTEDGQVFIECGTKSYCLPAGDVTLLPVANTTTESIAAYLFDQVLPQLRHAPGLVRAELTLAEAADTAATIDTDL